MGTETSSAPGYQSSWFLNAGTMLRILLTPVIMALALHDGSQGLACALFLFAAATDWFDGYFARKWDVSTTLGSFLDTTADKLLVTGVLIALVAAERVSPWIAGIIIGREIVILGLRGVVAIDGTVMKASAMARIKTFLQMGAIALAIVRPDVLIGGIYLDQWAMAAATIVTVTTAWDYLRTFADALRAE